MRIDFTKEQYETLLKLVYCWAFMINWPRNKSVLEVDALCDYIFSKAKNFWLDKYVEEVWSMYQESDILEDAVANYINTFTAKIWLGVKLPLE
jgi:hypothetical protein